MSKLDTLLQDFDWNMIMSEDMREWSKAFATSGRISLALIELGREEGLKYISLHMAALDRDVRAQYKFFGYDGNEIVEKFLVN